MRKLSTSDILDLWERGARLHPLDRALLTLNAAIPEASPETIADWPLGQRNRALLEMHIAAFGPRLQGWSTCPRCEEKMEFDLDARALVAQYRIARNHSITSKSLAFRLPTTRDLAEIVQNSNLESAPYELVRRCLTSADSIGDWSEHDFAALEEAMALADPLAEVRLSLTCPVCGKDSEETIDPVSFLWSEIEARARLTFWEVHAIACTYGWSEGEILSLSPARRAHYMEMVQA